MCMTFLLTLFLKFCHAVGYKFSISGMELMGHMVTVYLAFQRNPKPFS